MNRRLTDFTELSSEWVKEYIKGTLLADKDIRRKYVISHKDKRYVFLAYLPKGLTKKAKKYRQYLEDNGLKVTIKHVVGKGKKVFSGFYAREVKQ